MALSKYKTITEALTSGDQVEVLKAEADLVGRALDSSNSDRDIASLSLRLLNIMERLEEVSPQKKETAVEKRKREAAEKKAKDSKKE